MTSFCCQMPWILTGFLGNLCRRRAKFIDVGNIGLRFDRRCNRSPRRLLSYCSRCSDRFCSDHRNVCSVTVSQKITKLLLARLNGRICVGCPTSVRPLPVPCCKQTPAMRVINRLRRSQCFDNTCAWCDWKILLRADEFFLSLMGYSCLYPYQVRLVSHRVFFNRNVTKTDNI